MPGRKQPSALQRVKALSSAENDGQSDETTSEQHHAGQVANSASDLSSSIRFQEHLASSEASSSDEVDNPLSGMHVSDDDDGEEEATGAVDQDRTPDLPEGAPDVKRRKICIPEVKLR